MIIPVDSWSYDNNANELSDASTKLILSPSDVTLSENMRNFEFVPTQSLTLPTLSEVSIKPIAYIPVGSMITITSYYATITLTASSTPSVGEFWTNPTALATPSYFSQVAQSIADAISQSLSFASNYNTTLATSSYITVRAKQNGDIYDLTFSSDVPSSFLVAYVLGSYKYLSQTFLDYSCFCEIYIDYAEFQTVFTKYNSTLVDTYRIDSNTSTANIDVKVIKNYLNPILPIHYTTPSSVVYYMDMGELSNGILNPSLDEMGVQKRLILPYFVLYGDSFKYVANGQRKRYTKGVSAVRWVQLGAYDELNPYNMLDYTWIPNVSKTFKWLTSCPQFKVVTYDSHEYVQTICKKTSIVGNYGLVIDYKFYDGLTYQEIRPTFPYEGVSTNGVNGNISFDVSPTALDIASVETLNGKLVESYSVRLRWETAPSVFSFSDSKKYTFDRGCYSKKKNVIFLNEFGAWDSIEFKGQISKEVNKEYSNIQRVLPFNANTIEGISSEVSLNIETDITTLYTLNSGLLNNSNNIVGEHLDWASKIVESSSVYIWDETLNKYRNIIIVDYVYGTDTKINGDSISITYRYTTDTNTISR